MNPNNDTEPYDYLFKIVLIGDAGVGKTCIVQRFKSGVWVESQASTIGVDFCMKSCEVNGKKIKLQVWDTAGQERFRTITQSYYRSANGVVCAFDLTRQSTFLNVEKWMNDVSKFCEENVSKLLIGNKCDLTEERAVSREECAKVGSYYSVVDYIETSAKDNTNIEASFIKLATVLLEKHSSSNLQQEPNTVFGLGSRTKPVKSTCC
ncbi:unnamed protein product [Clavelina lepadiformis]|uniref:Ras-related protein Rab-43 n=1 Tax=Clavelina lepadiformis TaxID=159417 RepID=A0ABP0GI97_CLALP